MNVSVRPSTSNAMSTPRPSVSSRTRSAAFFVSVADTAIVPLQDVLGRGSEARMNLPGCSQGNWGWRYPADDLTPALRKRLRALTDGSGRTPRKPEPDPREAK